MTNRTEPLDLDRLAEDVFDAHGVPFEVNTQVLASLIAEAREAARLRSAAEALYDGCPGCAALVRP